MRFEEVLPGHVTNLYTDFISVRGEISHGHAGTIRVASDQRTVIFDMPSPFSEDELVTVSLNPKVQAQASGRLQPYEYQFAITAPMPDALPPGLHSVKSSVQSDDFAEQKANPSPPVPAAPVTANPEVDGAVVMPNGVSIPSDFPKVVITVLDNPSPGYLFLETGFTRGAPKYTMILDSNGNPIWYRRGRVWDFKVQSNGQISWCVDRPGGFLTFDRNFNYIKSHHTVNGYMTDYHEFELLEDGTSLMLGSCTNTIDLSRYLPDGRTVDVIEGVIQEFTPEGDLIFQWRAWDHYDIGDNQNSPDFPHMNALDVDEDGHILVSCRHMNEVTKIHRDTGDILWRLSGSKNSFTFVDDPYNGTSGQHDITALGSNHYLIFDNGGQHVPQHSRAVEYELDLTNMTATLVWQYSDDESKYTHWMGNAQRLPDGNTLVNFVRPYYPAVVEADSNGVKQLELTLAPNSDHYRSFRFPWTGAVAAPYLIAEAGVDNVTLLFNKFGDHSVDHYRIYGGTAYAPTTLLATTSATLIRLTNVVNEYRNYFRVTALDTNGLESDYSNQESLVVQITLPGQNMLWNADFSEGSFAWTWEVTPPASAQWTQSNQVSHFAISNGGTFLSDVQLSQGGLRLVQNKEYTLEFEAWSTAPRMFEANVDDNLEGGTIYSGIQPFTITPLTNRYTFHFLMLEPSDFNARLVFNAGSLAQDVFLANVSLHERLFDPGDFNRNACVGFDDLAVLANEWQQARSSLVADLNGDGRVDFADFVLFSETWSGTSNCPELPMPAP